MNELRAAVRDACLAKLNHDSPDERERPWTIRSCVLLCAQNVGLARAELAAAKGAYDDDKPGSPGALWEAREALDIALKANSISRANERVREACDTYERLRKSLFAFRDLAEKIHATRDTKGALHWPVDKMLEQLGHTLLPLIKEQSEPGGILSEDAAKAMVEARSAVRVRSVYVQLIRRLDSGFIAWELGHGMRTHFDAPPVVAHIDVHCVDRTPLWRNIPFSNQQIAWVLLVAGHLPDVVAGEATISGVINEARRNVSRARRAIWRQETDGRLSGPSELDTGKLLARQFLGHEPTPQEAAEALEKWQRALAGLDREDDERGDDEAG